MAHAWDTNAVSKVISIEMRVKFVVLFCLLQSVYIGSDIMQIGETNLIIKGFQPSSTYTRIDRRCGHHKLHTTLNGNNL